MTTRCQQHGVGSRSDVNHIMTITSRYVTYVTFVSKDLKAHSYQATMLHWRAKIEYIQPILPVTVSVKKIKSAARQRWRGRLVWTDIYIFLLIRRIRNCTSIVQRWQLFCCLLSLCVLDFGIKNLLSLIQTIHSKYTL